MRKVVAKFFGGLLCLLVFAGSVVTAQTQPNNDSDDLETLVNKFKTERKKPCGERQEAVRLGKLIYEVNREDLINSKLIETIYKLALQYEKEDEVCRRQEKYNKAFKTKNWIEFFALSREFLAEENDSPLALDLMLTHVSVGYDRIVVDRKTEYIEETIFFALKAIDLLEKGVKSKNGRYGVFDPFLTNQGALSWCYFIVGYLKYDWQGKIDTSKKDEAIPYFYKAVQVGEKKNDLTIYLFISEYYIDKVCFRWSLTGLKAKDENALGNLERAIEMLARGRKNAIYKKKETLSAVENEIKKLFNLRFNLPQDFVYDGLEPFLDNIISQPLHDPQSEIKSTWKTPPDLKIIENKVNGR